MLGGFPCRNNEVAANSGKEIDEGTMHSYFMSTVCMKARLNIDFPDG
jgi:hypothetical protein